jgi:hypothetical protein
MVHTTAGYIFIPAYTFKMSLITEITIYFGVLLILDYRTSVYFMENGATTVIFEGVLLSLILVAFGKLLKHTF